MSGNSKDVPAHERLGTEIDRYRLLELVGRGGAGAVYRAFDTKLERTVAVKLLHGDSRLHGETRSRFRREARVLSQLDHPNLCKVHDFVETEQDDAIVLELIEGLNLSQALQQQPSFATRLEIAESVASVLCAVHRQGVLHRDLKPQNLMVRGDGVVKVLDFGLAGIQESGQETLTLGASANTEYRQPPAAGKEVSPELAVLTRRGGVMGTPAYMSPEQARGERVTQASDMYSFGLILQTLFSSSPPYEPGLSTAEVLRRSKLGEHPAPEGMRRDLRALTLALLSQEPAQRPTAEQTLAAIRRAKSRNSRFLWASAIAAGVLLLAVVGAVRFTDLRAERARAIEAEARATATVDFLVNMFQAVRLGGQPLDQITVKELFARAIGELPTSMPEDEPTRVKVVNTLGAAMVELGLYSDLEGLLASVAGTRPKELGDNPSAARLLNLRAQNAGLQGNLAEQAALLRERLELAEPSDRSGFMVDLANSLKRNDQLTDAESVAREALALARELDRNPSEGTSTGMIVAFGSLGNILFSSNQPEEARLVFEEGHEYAIARYGSDDLKASTMLNGLLQVAMAEGRKEDAVELARQVYQIQKRAFGPEHPVVAVAASNLAGRLGWAGLHQEAIELGEEALAVRRKIYGNSNTRVAFSLESLGWSKRGIGDVEEGQKLLEEALEMRLRLQGETSEDLKIPLRLLGYIHRDAERYAEAESYFERQLELAEARIEAGQPSEGRGPALSNLATLYARAGWSDKARSVFPDLMDARIEEEGIDDRRTLEDAAKYADFLEDAGDTREADAIRRRFSLDSSASREE